MWLTLWYSFSTVVYPTHHVGRLSLSWTWMSKIGRCPCQSTTHPHINTVVFNYKCPWSLTLSRTRASNQQLRTHARTQARRHACAHKHTGTNTHFSFKIQFWNELYDLNIFFFKVGECNNSVIISEDKQSHQHPTSIWKLSLYLFINHWTSCQKILEMTSHFWQLQ